MPFADLWSCVVITVSSVLLVCQTLDGEKIERRCDGMAWKRCGDGVHRSCLDVAAGSLEALSLL